MTPNSISFDPSCNPVQKPVQVVLCVLQTTNLKTQQRSDPSTIPAEARAIHPPSGMCECSPYLLHTMSSFQDDELVLSLIFLQRPPLCTIRELQTRGRTHEKSEGGIYWQQMRELRHKEEKKQGQNYTQEVYPDWNPTSLTAVIFTTSHYCLNQSSKHCHLKISVTTASNSNSKVKTGEKEMRLPFRITAAGSKHIMRDQRCSILLYFI